MNVSLLSYHIISPQFPSIRFISIPSKYPLFPRGPENLSAGVEVPGMAWQALAVPPWHVFVVLFPCRKEGTAGQVRYRVSTDTIKDVRSGKMWSSRALLRDIIERREVQSKKLLQG